MIKEERELKLELIDDKDGTFQGRIFYEEDKINNLAEDIKIFGQRASIGVRKSPTTKGKYQLIYGFQRTKAFRRLGKKEIKAIIYFDLTDRELEELAVRDNESHGDLTEIERAYQCSKLKGQDWTIEKLCLAFNTKKSTIYNWLKIIRGDKILLKLIHKSHLTLYQGIEIMREKSYSRRLEIMHDCLINGIGVKRIKELINNPKIGSSYCPLYGGMECYYKKEVIEMGEIEKHCKTCPVHTKFKGIKKINKRTKKTKQFYNEKEFIEFEQKVARESIKFEFGQNSDESFEEFADWWYDSSTQIEVVENNNFLLLEIKEFLEEYENKVGPIPKIRGLTVDSEFAGMQGHKTAREQEKKEKGVRGKVGKRRENALKSTKTTNLAIPCD